MHEVGRWQVPYAQSNVWPLSEVLKLKQLCRLSTPALTFPVLSSLQIHWPFFSRNLYYLNLTKPSSFGVGMQELPPSLMDALEQSFLPENRRLNGEHHPITQPAFLLLMLGREEGSSQLLPTK